MKMFEKTYAIGISKIQIKEKKIIKRVGVDKGGYWKILKTEENK